MRRCPVWHHFVLALLRRRFGQAEDRLAVDYNKLTRHFCQFGLILRAQALG